MAYGSISAVTGGDSHDHDGDDGAQIDHTKLSNIGTNTHAQIDTAVTKIGTVETNADVTDDANVRAALAAATATLDCNAQTITNVGDVDGRDVAADGATADAALPKGGGEMSGNITMASTELVDGRDLSVDGAKLDLVEASADVTDDANVRAALAAATATIDLNGQTITDVGDVDGRDVAADGSKLDLIEAAADVTDTTNVTAAGAVMDSELIDSSAGAGDAAKPVKLDGGGRLDSTMMAVGSVTVNLNADKTAFIDVISRGKDIHLFGDWRALTTAQALDSGNPINVTTGLTRIALVLNAGSDFAGSVTLTGTTVDRVTGARTGADTEVLTIAGLTTDGETTDANGFLKHAITDGYLSSKWFLGDVVISTTDVTLTDVDVYEIAYFQYHDATSVSLNGVDFTGMPVNTAAFVTLTLYSITLGDGDKFNLTAETTYVLETADVTANVFYRLRHNGLSVALDGNAGEGAFLFVGLGRASQPDWEDVTIVMEATTAEVVSVVFV